MGHLQTNRQTDRQTNRTGQNKIGQDGTGQGKAGWGSRQPDRQDKQTYRESREAR